MSFDSLAGPWHHRRKQNLGCMFHREDSDRMACGSGQECPMSTSPWVFSARGRFGPIALAVAGA